MNLTLIRVFLIQRFTSPMRLGLMFVIGFFSLVGATMGQLSSLQGIALPFALLFATGAIGQDVSNGTLQMLLSRPVTRPSYVLNRWLGSMLAAGAVALTTIGIGALLVIGNGGKLDAIFVVRMLLEATTDIAAFTAVTVMMSAFVAGIGDLALYGASLFMTSMIGGAAEFYRLPWVTRASRELMQVLLPKVTWEWLGVGAPPSLLPLVSCAFTIALSLAVAITVVNRKELSYAHG